MFSGEGWENRDAALDRLNCRFGSEDRKKEVCDDVYWWLWDLDGGKYEPDDTEGKAKAKNKFYDFKKKIDGPMAEQIKRRQEQERKKKQQEEEQRRQQREEEEKRRASEGHEKGDLAPKPKETSKKKRTKPGTFGYYGWYVEWVR
ncbi:hypothetical protein MHSWG343_00950 [Candidatus Mycoplasma haematohominis]|uniref:Uncharacterized protein n=1 Tax=Candidatus Mycoplasma haematohominis TaxID=1494318 RepID=A0A478FPX9_9MOLU|nr:hypothetical protein MHSWG343_00950 [Candidatus Mycoplasma haemohominis]